MLRIIDFRKSGNGVRFYLSAREDISDATGDDWDDRPYEYNAGQVYDEYVDDYIDYFFDMDMLVLEPRDGHGTNSDYCKDDFKENRLPIIVAVPKKMHEDSWADDYPYWAASDKVKKYYIGDKVVQNKKKYKYVSL